MTDAWYYVENDMQAGPVSSDQLRRFLSSPRGGEAVLVWRSGFSGWKAAGQVNELADVFERPPPVPGNHEPVGIHRAGLSRTPNDTALMAVEEALRLDFGGHGDDGDRATRPPEQRTPGTMQAGSAAPSPPRSAIIFFLFFFLFFFLAGVFAWAPSLYER
jgi:hypothetical protein